MNNQQKRGTHSSPPSPCHRESCRTGGWGEVKQQAFNLYFQSGLTQQQIADMLDINRKTLYTWIRDGDWKRARHTARHAPTLLVQQYYDQLTAMNAYIAARPGQPFPTKDEADVMRKLSMVIKHVRTTWTPSDMMDIFTLFQSDLVHKGQIDKATELMPMLDRFVQETSGASKSYEPLREYYNGLTEDEEYDRWLNEQQQQPDEETNTNTPSAPTVEEVHVNKNPLDLETGVTAAHSPLRGGGRQEPAPIVEEVHVNKNPLDLKPNTTAAHRHSDLSAMQSGDEERGVETVMVSRAEPWQRALALKPTVGSRSLHLCVGAETDATATPSAPDAPGQMRDCATTPPSPSVTVSEQFAAHKLVENDNMDFTAARPPGRGRGRHEMSSP